MLKRFEEARGGGAVRKLRAPALAWSADKWTRTSVWSTGPLMSGYEVVIRLIALLAA
jgi:hypothetical protein